MKWEFDAMLVKIVECVMGSLEFVLGLFQCLGVNKDDIAVYTKTSTCRAGNWK